MNQTARPMSAIRRLRGHERWTARGLLITTTLTALACAGIQIWAQYEALRTQQRQQIESTQRTLEQALSGAMAHVRTMADIAQREWTHQGLSTANLSALRTFEQQAPSAAPWSALPPHLRTQLGGFFLDPKAGDSIEKINTFKRLAVAAMPIVATQHTHDTHLKWSYFYDAEGSISLLYPHVTEQQYLHMTQARDMHEAQTKAFDAAGTLPLQAVGPLENLKRELVWTAPYVDVGGQGMMVTLLAPIYANKQFVAAAGTDLTLQQLDELLRASPVAHARLWIVDGQGGIVASSNPPARPLTTRLALGEVLDHPQQQAAQRLGLQPSTWTLVALTPRSPLITAAVKQTWGTMTLAVGMMMLVMVLLRLQTRRVTEPALQLVEFVHALAQGPHPTPTKVPRLWRDCFSQVASAAVDQRATLDALQQEHAQLTQQVQTRTQALQQVNQQLDDAQSRAADLQRKRLLALGSVRDTIAPASQALGALATELQNGPPSGEVLAPIRLAHGQLQTLLTDLGDLTQLANGQLVLNAAPFVLQTLLNHLAEQSASAAPLSATRLIARNVNGGAVCLVGDSARLSQALIQLARDVSAQTQHDAVQLHAFAHPEPPDQVRLEIHVFAGDSVTANAPALDALAPPANDPPEVEVEQDLRLSLSQALIHAMGGRLSQRASTPTRSATWVVSLQLPRDSGRHK